MSHPAIDEHEVERPPARGRRRARRLHRGRRTRGPGGPGEHDQAALVGGTGEGRGAKAAVPVVARLRQELVTASAGDQADVRAQVAELREELARTRAEHAAELAALHEELADAKLGQRPTDGRPSPISGSGPGRPSCRRATW